MRTRKNPRTRNRMRRRRRQERWRQEGREERREEIQGAGEGRHGDCGRSEVPRKTPKGTVVLRGATVVTMNGDEVLKNADIVVEDNRIKRVGAKGSVPSGRESDRRDGQDDCAGICRHARALDGNSARDSGYAELGVSCEPCLRRDGRTRRADRDERHVRVSGSGR